jgi:hypothetical protein
VAMAAASLAQASLALSKVSLYWPSGERRWNTPTVVSEEEGEESPTQLTQLAVLLTRDFKGLSRLVELLHELCGFLPASELWDKAGWLTKHFLTSPGAHGSQTAWCQLLILPPSQQQLLLKISA